MNSPADDQPDVIPLTHLEQLREAQDVIRQEAVALNSLADGLTSAFTDAVQLIHQATGTLIVTGVGKAGLVGQKIVATMSSTGTRAQFLHPTEAVHGDLGCIGPNDVVLALSNSGRSDEILRLLPLLSRLKIPVVAITRDHDNALASAATCVLVIGKHNEAGALGLAPTVSTTAMMALGDALALVLSRAKNFSESDFAKFHPAGSLGRKLCPVSEIMRTTSQIRIAHESQTVRQVLSDIQSHGRRTGAVILTDAEGHIAGIFTDSDLAKLFQRRQEHLIDQPISSVMTSQPTTTGPDTLLPAAIQLMSERKISELPVIDSDGMPIGLVDITDVIELTPTAEPSLDDDTLPAKSA